MHALCSALTKLYTERTTKGLHVPAGAWISVACQDGERLNSGESLRDAVVAADRCPYVLAIGINCSAPDIIEACLQLASSCTSKPLLCYPNSGEDWDHDKNCWTAHGNDTNEDTNRFAEMARSWYESGSRMIGGCCRTTPEDIGKVRKMLQTITF